MIIRARCLLPLSSAPVDNGAVATEQGRIQWLGRWRDCEVGGQPVADLGEVVLMPGLINAHCHLDYTNMAGQIPPPRSFPDWVKTILSFKAHWSFSEFAESWLKGARMLLDHGTTTVADTESVPELPPETWKSTPLRMISYCEMTGVKGHRSPAEVLGEALDGIERWPCDERKEAGLSPHALYSTAPELMRLSATTSAERGLRLSTHLAESEDEYRMFAHGTGAFYDWLKGQRKMEDCGRVSPIQLASEYQLLSERLLIAHANYLASSDAETLARSGASVVHCPRSHQYFGHAPFPFAELRKAGVNICLGTDSLASVPKLAGHTPALDLWAEMQLFATRHPGVSPREIFDMVTVRSAAALGKTGQIGCLQEGAFADVAALGYTGRVDDPRICEELLYGPSVREVFIAGEQVRSAP